MCYGEGANLPLGTMDVQDETGQWVTRELAPPAKTAGSTAVPPGATVRAGKNGVVFMAVAKAGENIADGPFSSMRQIESKNIIPPSAFGPNVADTVLPFVKVQDTAWGNTGREFSLVLMAQC
jgi:hypothetical protein